MADRPAQDPAQDVAATLVGRQDVVGDQEGDRPRVVGDDLVAEALGLERLGIVADQLAHPGVDRGEQVRVVVGGDLLEDARQPLEAHPGVDAGERQRDAPVRSLVELHEHEVPDLEPARAVLAVVRHALGALGELEPTIEVDLAARAARSGVGHPPEVVVVAGVDVAPSRHPLGRQADLVAPDVPGDLVVLVGGRRQPVAGNAQVAGQEVPRPVDRLALEVVAEAPVAEHLEQRVMTRRAADLLEVVVLAGDAEAALVVDGPRVRAGLGADQDVLELDHPGVREQQRGVAGRHEAGAGHHGVAALGEEVDEPATDLGGGQRHDPRIGDLHGRWHRAQWYRTERPEPTTPSVDRARRRRRVARQRQCRPGTRCRGCRGGSARLPTEPAAGRDRHGLRQEMRQMRQPRHPRELAVAGRRRPRRTPSATGPARSAPGPSSTWSKPSRSPPRPEPSCSTARRILVVQAAPAAAALAVVLLRPGRPESDPSGVKPHGGLAPRWVDERAAGVASRATIRR